MYNEPMFPPTQGGWIEVIAGGMFSGKTEELIRRLRRAEIAGQQVRVFKPQHDNRYSHYQIVSHTGEALDGMAVASARDLLLRAQGADVVGIDEGQFFDESLVAVTNALANRGLRVIVAGLDMDYQGRPFGPMPQLMAVAEFVTKLHAICRRTGHPAHYSLRHSAAEDLLQLGGYDQYEPVSRHVFWQEMKAHQQREKGQQNLFRPQTSGAEAPTDAD